MSSRYGSGKASRFVSFAGAIRIDATATASHACGSRPIAEIYWQTPSSIQWQLVSQVGKHGEGFPLELGGASCPAPKGCRVSVRTRDGVAASAARAKDGVVDGSAAAAAALRRSLDSRRPPAPE